MTPKIVELNVGKTLEDISAGVLIIEEMKEQEERYEKDLNNEIEEAEDEQLRAEVG